MNFNHGIHTIVCDLDGTLLNENSEISDYNLNTIQKAMDHGIQFMIATGRRYHSALPHIARFKGKVQVVANNGQILKEYPGDRRVSESFLPEAGAKSICNEILNHGFFPLLHVDWFDKGIDLVLQNNSNFLSRYLEHSRAMAVSALDKVDHSRVTVICIYERNMRDLQMLASKLYSFTHEHNLRIVLTTIHNVGPCMEVLPAHVSKWTGVETFLRKDNKNPQGVLSFGDEANDFELISQSGLGVAMKNAIPELKQIAKIISPHSNHEDGVGRLIQEILPLFNT